MPDFNRIFFLLVIILSFFSLYKLVQRRNEILHEYDNQKQEAFETMPLINNTTSVSLPLCQYVVMSSWNSATDKNLKVSLDALENVIVRGYRFLDLEIYSMDDTPKVSFSIQKNYDTIETPPILFTDVCRRIAMTAFSSHNGKDPLFLHLRIKSKNPKIFPQIASILKSEFINRLVSEPVTAETTLSELMGKLVIVVDRDYFPLSETYSCDKGKCTVKFASLVNMFTSTFEFPSMSYSDVMAQPVRPLLIIDSSYTNAKKMGMATPRMGELNEEGNSPDFYNLLKKHKIQIFPQKAYYRDSNLDKYEEFFAYNGSQAFMRTTIACDVIQNEGR